MNFTDGLDGLAAGAMAMVCAAYVLITFWQFRNACATAPGVGCYNVRDPLDLALIAAATAGACIGFLWWNAAPAKIFMGDTGSLALGGIIAGLSVTSRTEMLAVVIGALFVAEVTSVVVQILAFRTTGRRVFRMAPFHHHFELVGWAETTVIIRFWLLTAIACGLGVALFYSEWLAASGPDVTRPCRRAARARRPRAGDRGGHHRAFGERRAGADRGAADHLRRRPAGAAAPDHRPASVVDHRRRRRAHRRLRPGRHQPRIAADRTGAGGRGRRGHADLGRRRTGLAARPGRLVRPPRRWLVVTGTNGKTTTTSMLHAMLVAAGRGALLCGNIGNPVIDMLAEPAELLAVELSSFQLHWAPSVRPEAGVVLNVAEDHLDWHGSMDAYAATRRVRSTAGWRSSGSTTRSRPGCSTTPRRRSGSVSGSANPARGAGCARRRAGRQRVLATPTASRSPMPRRSR